VNTVTVINTAAISADILLDFFIIFTLSLIIIDFSIIYNKYLCFYTSGILKPSESPRFIKFYLRKMSSYLYSYDSHIKVTQLFNKTIKTVKIHKKGSAFCTLPTKEKSRTGFYTFRDCIYSISINCLSGEVSCDLSST